MDSPSQVSEAEPPQAELRAFTPWEKFVFDLKQWEHKLLPGTAVLPPAESPFPPVKERLKEDAKALGTLLDKAGEVVRDWVAAQLF